MTKSCFGVDLGAGFGSGPAQPDQPIEAAWRVLDAAHDLDDNATVAACRRVIDAILNGTSASSSDLQVVVDYFR